jgi:hypothetical protein
LPYSSALVAMSRFWWTPLVFEALADGAFTAIVSPHILGELSAVLALPKLRARSV